MSVLGLGTDIVSVGRMNDLLQRYEEKFLQRCFREDEISWILSRGRGKAASAAVRWAAKEAFLKALGRSVAHVPYGDIEVVRQPEGPVSLALHGRAAEELAALGPVECLLSLSHETEFATATVLIQTLGN